MSKNAEIGDLVKVVTKDREYIGILMPSVSKDKIVLKLSSGYNIGLNKEGAEIVLLEKRKPQPPAPSDEERGRIAILGCGGTISSKVEYRTGAVFPSISTSELVASFPQIKDIASVHSRVLFNLLSEDITPHHWSLIAEEVYNEIKDGVEGVVLMHGTDTMHYSSAALSFALEDLSLPVVFVGAQRSSDRPSSDNELNFLNAVFSATQDIAEVSVCMHATVNDDFAYLHRGTKVRKMHSSRRDAFKSINTLPLAKVDYRNSFFEPLIPYKKRKKGNVKLKNKFSDNVALLYIYPGIKSSFIEKLSDYDGIVLIGTGLGHVPTNIFNDKFANSIVPALSELIESGVVVVVSSQTIAGRINMNVYSTGRMLKSIGVIGDGMDWTPETAYVKLCWALAQTKDPKKVKDIMLKNIAGEISERSYYDEYFFI